MAKTDSIFMQFYKKGSGSGNEARPIRASIMLFSLPENFVNVPAPHRVQNISRPLSRYSQRVVIRVTSPEIDPSEETKQSACRPSGKASRRSWREGWWE